MAKTDPLVSMASRWAKKIGRRQAMGKLLARDVGASTAEKICKGTYTSSPGEDLSDILVEEMSKDGFRLSEGRAS